MIQLLGEPTGRWGTPSGCHPSSSHLPEGTPHPQLLSGDAFSVSISSDILSVSMILGTLKASPLSNRGYERSEHPR